MNKPVKPKPQFYAATLKDLQEIAMSLGYNLILHGSLNRDMDLVAIPWIDSPANHLKLIQALDHHLRGDYYQYIEQYMPKALPAGRSTYIINLNRDLLSHTPYRDAEYYLDISITPLLN